MCGRGDHPPYDAADLAGRSQEDRDLYNMAEDERIERLMAETYPSLPRPDIPADWADLTPDEVDEAVEIDRLADATHGGVGGSFSSAYRLDDVLDFIGSGLSEEVVDKLDYSVRGRVVDRSDYAGEIEGEVTSLVWDHARRSLIIELTAGLE